MSRVCTICDKGYKKVVRRSHSMQRTKARLYPNLQWLKLEHGQRVKACTKCIRTHNKKMAQVTT